jgi:hypothetical protein
VTACKGVIPFTYQRQFSRLLNSCVDCFEAGSLWSWPVVIVVDFFDGDFFDVDFFDVDFFDADFFDADSEDALDFLAS